MRPIFISIPLTASLAIALTLLPATGSATKRTGAEAKAAASGGANDLRKPGPNQAEHSESELFRTGEEFLEKGDFLKAAEAMETFLKKFPASPYGSKAELHLANIKFETSSAKSSNEQLALIDEFRAIINKYPATDEAARAALKIGELYERIGFKYEAIASYTAVIEQYAAKEAALSARRRLGFVLYRDGRYASAAAEFLRVMEMEKDPISVGRAAFMAGNSFFKQKKFRQARLLYQKGLSADEVYLNKNPETIFNIGETHFQLKKFAIARDYYVKGLKTHPQADPNKEYMARIGDTYLEEKNYPEALKVYAGILGQYPDSRGALMSKVRMAGIGVEKPGLAPGKLTPSYAPYLNPMKAYEEILKDNPDGELAELALLNIGYIHSRVGRLVDSLEALGRLLAQYPSSLLRPRALSQLAALMPKVIEDYHRQGKFKELLRIYYQNARYLGEDFDAPKMDLGVAWALGKAGLNEKALEIYRELFERPINAELRAAAGVGMANAYVILQEPDMAEKTISSLPRSALKGDMLANVARIVGGIFFSRGQYEKAAEEYVKAASIGKDLSFKAEFYRLAGKAKKEAGKAAEAANFFKLSAELVDKAAGTETKRPELKIDILYEIGDSSYEAGLDDEALSYYAMALRANPNHPASSLAAYRIAQIYSKLFSATAKREFGEKADSALKGINQGSKVSPWGNLAGQLSEIFDLERELAPYKGK